MADTKVSDESAATTPTGAELVRIVQGGSSKQTTLAVMGHQFRGARARMTADDTAQNATGTLVISFDAAEFDTDGFWSAGSPSRLTIPAGLGITHVELTGMVYVSSGTADTYCSAYILHRNSADAVQPHSTGVRHMESGNTSWALNPHTGPLPVTAGDYFTLVILQETDTSITVEGDDNFRTSLSLKVVGMAPI